MSDVIAIIAAAGAIASAVVGVILAFRSSKAKARQAALAEAELAEGEAIDCRQKLYAARMALADHGIDVP